jgi:hypothetical protein
MADPNDISFNDLQLVAQNAGFELLRVPDPSGRGGDFYQFAGNPFLYSGLQAASDFLEQQDAFDADPNILQNIAGREQNGEISPLIFNFLETYLTNRIVRKAKEQYNPITMAVTTDDLINLYDAFKTTLDKQFPKATSEQADRLARHMFDEPLSTDDQTQDDRDFTTAFINDFPINQNIQTIVDRGDFRKQWRAIVLEFMPPGMTPAASTKLMSDKTYTAVQNKWLELTDNRDFAGIPFEDLALVLMDTFDPRTGIMAGLQREKSVDKAAARASIRRRLHELGLVPELPPPAWFDELDRRADQLLGVYGNEIAAAENAGQRVPNIDDVLRRTPIADSFPTVDQVLKSSATLEQRIIAGLEAAGREVPTDPERLAVFTKAVKAAAGTAQQRMDVAKSRAGTDVEIDPGEFITEAVGEFPTDEQLGFTPSGIRADAFAPFPPGMDIARQAQETDAERSERFKKGAAAYAGYVFDVEGEDIDEEEAERRLRELEAQIAEAERRAGDRMGHRWDKLGLPIGLSDEERAEAKKEAARLRKFYERFVAPPAPAPAQKKLTPEEQAAEDEQNRLNFLIQGAMGIREAQAQQKSARAIFSQIAVPSPFTDLEPLPSIRLSADEDLSRPTAELARLMEGLGIEEAALSTAKEESAQRIRSAMNMPLEDLYMPGVSRTFGSFEAEAFTAAAKQQQELFSTRAEALRQRRFGLEQAQSEIEREDELRRGASLAATPLRKTVV